MTSNPANINQLINAQLPFSWENRPKLSSRLSQLCVQIRQKFSHLANKPGVHTVIRMTSAGFHYTGDGDKARCDRCGLEVSGWTLDMVPWTVHSTQNPDCPFVCSLRPLPFSDGHSFLPEPPAVGRNPLKRRRTETDNLKSSSNTSVEARLFQQARRRTFADWPHHPTLSIEQMTKAGFTACNVDDRVTCTDCNIFCQQWTLHADEPCEVHKTISPQCRYVREKLVSNEQPRIANDDQSLSGPLASNHSSAQNTTNSFQFNQSLVPPALDTGHMNGPRTSDPVSETSITDKIRAGSFFLPIKHDETCVDCKKSLHNIGSYNNQTADFARWFVHCVHTKRYTADQVYRQIRRYKQTRQRIPKNNTNDNRMSDAAPTTNGQQLAVPNASTLLNLSGRLDLQIPEQLLGRDFSISTLRRIWRNECCIKQDDSPSDIDLLMACYILQKQIEHINGNKENLIKPSARVTAIREQAKKEEAERLAQRQAAARLAVQARSEHISTGTDVQMTQSNDPMSSNLCVLCLTEEKRLACIPCGHRAICVPCSQGLRKCPICRREIDAFVRLYI